MAESLGRFLTTDQICNLLGVKRWTLWNWDKQGRGPPRMRATDNEPWLYPERPFEDWARSRLVQSIPSKYGPEVFDHLVGDREQVRRDCKPERFLRF